MVNGELETYTDYDSIPEEFDHVIEFAPHTPEPPHTDEQHHEMSLWNSRLQELVRREKTYASSNQNR